MLFCWHWVAKLVGKSFQWHREQIGMGTVNDYMDVSDDSLLFYAGSLLQ